MPMHLNGFALALVFKVHCGRLTRSGSTTDNVNTLDTSSTHRQT